MREMIDTCKTEQEFPESTDYTQEQLRLLNEEKDLREEFASQNTSYKTSDPHVLLTDVFSEQQWQLEEMDDDEAAQPALFQYHRRKFRNGPAIVTKQQFDERFDSMTQKFLEQLDWSNVFLAGGAIHCSTPGDLDIFLYGLDSVADLNQKVQEIYDSFCKASGKTLDVIRTSRAVTIIAPYPARHLQIILRAYKSPAEVLLGFDNGACSVGFDGTTVWAMERFKRAVTKGYILIDPSRRSTTYESRLRKYATRGFQVNYPSLDKKRVNPDIFHRPNVSFVKGLKRLLLFEYFALRRREATCHRPGFSVGMPAETALEVSLMHHTSDYCDVAIPYGPNWYSNAIMKMLSQQDKAAFFSSDDFGHRHLFVSGIEGVINGVSGGPVWCMHCNKSQMHPLEKPADDNEASKFVYGPLAWDFSPPCLQDLDNGRIRTLMSGAWHCNVQQEFDEGVYMTSGKLPTTTMNHPLFMSLRQNKTRSKPASKSKKTVTPTGLFNFQNTHISSAKPLPQKSKLAVKSAVDPLRPIAEPYQPPAETRVPASFNPMDSVSFGKVSLSLEEPSNPYSFTFGTSKAVVEPVKPFAAERVQSPASSQEDTSVFESLSKLLDVIPSTIYEQTEVQGVSFFVDRNLPLDGPEVIPQLLSRCNASVVLRPDEADYVITTKSEASKFGYHNTVHPAFLLESLSYGSISRDNHFAVDPSANISFKTFSLVRTLESFIQQFALVPETNEPSANVSNESNEPQCTEFPKAEDYADCEHSLAMCDGCRSMSIKGLRFRCKTCSDYDLCLACFNGFPHQHHDFAVITDTSFTGSVSNMPAAPRPYPTTEPQSTVTRLFDKVTIAEPVKTNSPLPSSLPNVVSMKPAVSVVESKPLPSPKTMSSLKSPSEKQVDSGELLRNILHGPVSNPIKSLDRDTKAWNWGDRSQPYFPKHYVILRADTLQKTRLDANNNKYYVLELHHGRELGRDYYRVFCHYGRTDDLVKNPDAGQRCNRYVSSRDAAEAKYAGLYRQKTGRGYRVVELHSGSLGSEVARLLFAEHEKAMASPVKIMTMEEAGITAKEAAIVTFLFDEAVKRLTTSLDVTITARGIETPLGVLSLSQVAEGRDILIQTIAEINGNNSETKLIDLSNLFYSAIPHRIGRNFNIKSVMLRTMEDVNSKMDLLDLMTDMLNVSSTGGGASVLMGDDVVAKYNALCCTLTTLSPSSPEFQSLVDLFRDRPIEVETIVSVDRFTETAPFNSCATGNTQPLIHASGSANWMGILSRGLLLPADAVKKMKIKKTEDMGWLGHGLYFGNEAKTALKYAHPAGNGVRVAAICDVKLGQSKVHKSQQYNLTSAGPGYQSSHGSPEGISVFTENEYVVYGTEQVKIRYLVFFREGGQGHPQSWVTVPQSPASKVTPSFPAFTASHQATSALTASASHQPAVQQTPASSISDTLSSASTNITQSVDALVSTIQRLALGRENDPEVQALMAALQSNLSL